MSTTAPLFIAIRCEELPARLVSSAAEQLAAGLLALLSGIEHGPARVWATPRRIAVEVEAVALLRPGSEQLLTGPAASVAFKDGQPTAAAIGFARGKGLPPEAIEIVEGPKGPVIAVRVRQGGERVVDLVAAKLDTIVQGMKFPVGMRWQPGGPRWARPVHGLIALHGDQLIPATVLGIAAGRSTIGHRLQPEPFQVDSAAAWVEGLRERFVEPDRAVRRERVDQQLREAAAELGARIEVDPALLDEVTDLVEWPVVVACAFDPELLDLPPRLLVESMRVHQRVFPLWRAEGQGLDHRFLAVSNHPRAHEPRTRDTIATGNARVIGARFHDARFFYAEDRRKLLLAHDERLDRMQWIRDGGTMRDKAVRVAALARQLAPALGADPDHAERAGRLCKADLATQMVGEFPELQGHVGRLLARFEGEPEAVALAIEEHYLPRGASDSLPVSAVGRSVALADRLDTLAGCFAAGIRLKGSSDPLGLRRAAHGLLQLLLDSTLRQLPEPLFALALDGLGPELTRRSQREEALADLVEFSLARLQALLREEADKGVVDAVLGSGGERDPLALRARVRAMAELAKSPEFGPLKETFKRVRGPIREHLDPSYDPASLSEPAEQALHAALEQVRPRARQAAKALDYGEALRALVALKAPVDELFVGVMVVSPDEGLRRRRLGLLRSVADEFNRVADFTQLSAD